MESTSLVTVTISLAGALLFLTTVVVLSLVNVRRKENVFNESMRELSLIYEKQLIGTITGTGHAAAKPTCSQTSPDLEDRLEVSFCAVSGCA